MTTELEAGQAVAVETSDQSLMRRFRRGSQDAATQLYLRYAKRLRALVRNKCSSQLASRVDVDDIVQSVFRRFFQAAGKGLYDVPAGEELWKILLAIALNKIRNETKFHFAARRNVRRTTSGLLDGTLTERQQDGSGFAFLQLVIDEAMETLAPQARQMVELRIQGYEVAQIADLCGRSKRSTERILQEARTKLDGIFHEAE